MSVPPSQSYPCRSCGSPLSFDVTTANWRCSRCGATVPSVVSAGAPPSYPCPTCRSPLAFKTQYQAWYCDTCKQYRSAASAAPAQPAAPPRCPHCSAAGSYFSAYQRWYCPTCGRYHDHQPSGSPAPPSPAPTPAPASATPTASVIASGASAFPAAAPPPAPAPAYAPAGPVLPAIAAPPPVVAGAGSRRSRGFLDGIIRGQVSAYLTGMGLDVPTTLRQPAPGVPHSCASCGTDLTFLQEREKWFCPSCIEVRQADGRPIASPLDPALSPSVAPPPTVTASTAKPKPGIPVTVQGMITFEAARMVYRVTVANSTDEPLVRVRVTPFLGEGVIGIDAKVQEVALLEPGQRHQVAFRVRPKGEVRQLGVAARVEYYDSSTRKTKEITVAEVTARIIPPILTAVPISEDAWRDLMRKLVTVEETTEGVPFDGPAVLDVLSDILKDLNLYALEPKVTRGERIFRGVRRFHAIGEEQTRYGALLEVLGGQSQSKLILRAYASSPEALGGFYHRLMDEIEKRLKGKDLVSTTVVQHIHGDYVGGDKKDIKDSVIQGSKL